MLIALLIAPRGVNAMDARMSDDRNNENSSEDGCGSEARSEEMADKAAKDASAKATAGVGSGISDDAMADQGLGLEQTMQEKEISALEISRAMEAMFGPSKSSQAAGASMAKVEEKFKQAVDYIFQKPQNQEDASRIKGCIEAVLTGALSGSGSNQMFVSALNKAADELNYLIISTKDPNIALLRAFNVLDLVDQEDGIASRFFSMNPGVDWNRVPLRLNNSESPAHLIIPASGTQSHYTTVIPTLIPTGVKMMINMELMITSNSQEVPSSQENQEVREKLNRAFEVSYGSNIAGSCLRGINQKKPSQPIMVQEVIDAITKAVTAKEAENEGSADLERSSSSLPPHSQYLGSQDIKKTDKNSRQESLELFDKAQDALNSAKTEYDASFFFCRLGLITNAIREKDAVLQSLKKFQKHDEGIEEYLNGFFEQLNVSLLKPEEISSTEPLASSFSSSPASLKSSAATAEETEIGKTIDPMTELKTALRLVNEILITQIRKKREYRENLITSLEDQMKPIRAIEKQEQHVRDTFHSSDFKTRYPRGL